MLVVTIDGVDDDDAMDAAGFGGMGGACRDARLASGVRARKTGCDVRGSGVLGLGRTDGPAEMRERELGVVGV